LAHDDAEREALKAPARQRLAAGSLELASSWMGHLLDVLSRA
jgi:hypothetical protein